MVKAVVLVKSPKKLIAARLKRISSVKESFAVSGQFDAVAIIDVNVLTHVLLAQCLENHIVTKEEFKWVSLSAMVGSISDNYLGGWYSYRMTKAALNMFIRGLAIEWKRKNPNASVVAMHPGTTDSPMSSPFKVRPDKLYSPDLSANRIVKVIDSLDPSRTGLFINWDGNLINF